MTRAALADPCQALEAQRLEESAILYAELYDEDAALQALTESAVVGWPEYWGGGDDKSNKLSSAGSG